MWYAVIALVIALAAFVLAVYYGAKYGFERIEKDEHWYHD
ncbi:hypothetical protein BLA17378_08618 [Burkholderia aenigmatica]|uniref:Uncharacterized protein n=1 Tax=Burkholderia aenigmatica TaxID=2015348 RepID=A0ABY6YAI4_9BURK|nr:hypothetical protein BLA17378_08618 [Burkholderia aenigmatica]